MQLILLLGLHHLADVAFQPSWLIENKKKYLWSHYEHAFVWAFVVSIGLIILGIFEPWKFAFLLLVHGAIDYTGYVVLLRYYKKEFWWVYIDQALHYLQILLVFYV